VADRPDPLLSRILAADPAAAGAGALLLVDLDAVAANWRRLADRVAPAECAAVVKADAYGLGALPVVRRLSQAGARTFFTAHPQEAAALRPALPAGARLVVLHGLMPDNADSMAALGLVPVLNSLGEIALWQRTARTLGHTLPAMVHMDTGMNRLGLTAGETRTLAAEPHRLDGITVQAWISHFACADEAGHPMTPAQDQRFRAALATLPAAPASLANSAGIFRGAGLHHDLVRPGAALYGVNPTPELPNPMEGVVRLFARVLQVRDVDAGGSVGYGASHRFSAPGRVATLAAGYADGVMRSLSSRGAAVIGGVQAPVVGRISMDLMTIDVTAVPPRALSPGCFAELIGPHRPVDAVAAEAGTIGYEILTSLGGRYHRHYLP